MVLGVVKVKVLALLLGPAGVGIMGLYQNILGVAATLFGCGLSTSGVRQLAASDDPARRTLVRRALWIGSLTLGALALALMWWLRVPLSSWVFGHPRHAADVGLLGVGVLLTLVAASQTAILQGLLRIADLARVTVAGAAGGTMAGILCAYLWGHDGIVWFVITTPLFSAAAGAFFLRRVPAPPVHAASPAEVRAHLRALLRLGIPFMLASLVTMGTQLLARSLILRKLGMDAAGHFQAAWQISMVYIGFVLQAMSMDYYPRLSAAMAESPQAARRLMIDQTEMALLLGGPVLVGMAALAPVVIWALYSSDFSPAVSLLAWQSVGNLFKILSWPMSYSLLASGRSGLFFFTETSWNLLYLITLFFGLPALGLPAAGIGFLLSYVFYFLIQLPIAHRITGYRLPRPVAFLSSVYLAAAGGFLALLHIAPLAAMAAGTPAAVLLGFHSLRQIDRKVGLREWIARKLGKTPAA